MALPESTIEVAVKMPANCFFSKHHLNHQYHAKRALYLAHIAKAIKKEQLFDGQWEFPHADPRSGLFSFKTKKSGIADLL